MTKKRQIIPEYLQNDTKKWLKTVIKDYDLEGHHMKILIAAAEAWDRITEAREIVTKEGAYILDRFGQRKAHPALKVEIDNKTLFARLIRELNLDIEPPKAPGRPPALY